MSRRILALSLSIPPVILSTLACSIFGVGQDLPARAAEEWFGAVVSNEIELAMTRTCSALKESPQVMELWAAAEIEVNELPTDQGHGSTAGSEPELSTIERRGATAVVAVTNERPALDARMAGSDLPDVSWIMILEDGKWRWCGTRSNETTASTPASQETPQTQFSRTQAPTATYTKVPSPAPLETGSQEYPWKPCPNAPESRLHVGDRAFVGYEPPLPNRVREKPNWGTGRVVGRIYPGETVEILDGPVCNNQVVWWKVRSLDKLLTGWTAEGDWDNYWLIRIP